MRYYRTEPFRGAANDPAREDQVAELFRSPSIEFRAVTDFIGRRAWEIGSQHNDLSPPDCVHIATAEDTPADVLYTWEGSGVQGRRDPSKMLAYDGRIGAPALSIKEPDDPWPGLLQIEDLGRLTSLSGDPTAHQPPDEQPLGAAQD